MQISRDKCKTWEEIETPVFIQVDPDTIRFEGTKTGIFLCLVEAPDSKVVMEVGPGTVELLHAAAESLNNYLTRHQRN